MLKAGETFFSSVGCMDGRVQETVRVYGQKRFQAEFADTITEAGLVGVLSKEPVDNSLFESLKSKIEISLDKHHSRGIVVHGHEDCAGNPVDDEKHKQDVLAAAKLIKSLFKEVEVVPVFVEREEDRWVAKELSSV